MLGLAFIRFPYNNPDMQIIDHIFAVLGGATAIANETGAPVQTVHSWKVKESIPPWRRSELLRIKPVEGKMLSPDAIAYLHSGDRKPAAEQQAAA
jgi:hypothetical protein